eukprot:5473165-Pleurochrysis_carterae.AAC.1
MQVSCTLPMTSRAASAIVEKIAKKRKTPFELLPKPKVSHASLDSSQTEGRRPTREWKSQGGKQSETYVIVRQNASTSKEAEHVEETRRDREQ